MGDWDDMQEMDIDFEGFGDHFGGDMYDLSEDIDYMKEYEEIGNEMELENDDGLIKIKDMTDSDLKEIFSQTNIEYKDDRDISMIAEIEFKKRRLLKLNKITNNIKQKFNYK